MHLYKDAASVIELINSKKSTIKTAVAESKHKNKKQLHALVCESLKYKDVINQIIAATGVSKREKVFKDPTLTLVLLYDHLFGKGIQGSATYKDAVLRHKSALQSELARLKVKSKVVKNSDLVSQKPSHEEVLPRYVRVNTLRTTVEDVVEHFRREEHINVSMFSLSYSSYVETIATLKKRQFIPDPHIPGLLVFPAGTDFHDHVLYTTGHMILQDKASCLPAHVLAPPPGSHVIDACAAPGNKTTHLAALMNNKGKVFAFDKDVKRVSTLNMMTLKAGTSCTVIRHQDFLTVKTDDSKYANVEYVLVDPSCSGSGITGRLNSMTDTPESSSKERLEKLARFQATVLKHALGFPRVKRLVYSTCSHHMRENEDVVEDVLEQVKDIYELVNILPELPHRGEGDFAEAPKCIRMSPDKDKTNGFFLACFQRKEGAKILTKPSSHQVSTLDPESTPTAPHKPDISVKIREMKVCKPETVTNPKLKKKRVPSKAAIDAKAAVKTKTRPSNEHSKAKDKKKKKKNRPKNHRPVTA